MRFYSNKEKKRLIEMGLPISKKDKIRTDGKIVYIEDIPIFMIFEDEFLVPNLKLFYEKLDSKKDSTLIRLREYFTKMPSVYLDKGAVKFITKGADLMKPGIVSFDNFDQESLVLLKDSNFKKIVACGKTLFSSEELKNLDKGKVIVNLHHFGDKFIQD